MSRIGKKPILITDGAEATFKDGVLTVKGPKGEIKKNVDASLINIEIKDGAVTVTKVKESKDDSLWGTIASHVSNMVTGVTKGFEKKLILEGIGYKQEVRGSELHLALGFSHPVVVNIPDGLAVKAEKGILTVNGFNKELVGSFTAFIRDQKKPEPYKGKGYRYEKEVIKMKEGKKTV